MIKETVMAKDVCDLLNEMLAIDPVCVNTLFGIRAKCNQGIADHETIQVKELKDDNIYIVGFIGILNGLFGKNDNGWGQIYVEWNADTTSITHFGLSESIPETEKKQYSYFNGGIVKPKEEGESK